MGARNEGEEMKTYVDGAEVNKEISAAGLGGDKAEAFLVVEPLDSAGLALSGKLVRHCVGGVVWFGLFGGKGGRESRECDLLLEVDVTFREMEGRERKENSGVQVFIWSLICPSCPSTSGTFLPRASANRASGIPLGPFGPLPLLAILNTSFIGRHLAVFL